MNKQVKPDCKPDCLECWGLTVICCRPMQCRGCRGDLPPPDKERMKRAGYQRGGRKGGATRAGHGKEIWEKRVAAMMGKAPAKVPAKV